MLFLPTVIVRNWQMKLAAFGLALLLWSAVRVEAPTRSTLTIPVVVQLNDPRWSLVGEPNPSTVEVRVTGPAGDVFRLAVGAAQVTVPVEAVAVADSNVVIRDNWVSLLGLQGVTIEDVQPRSLQLHFERMRTVDLLVDPRLIGTLPQGLALAELPTVTPEVIRVTGPESRVDGLSMLPMEVLDLSEVQRSGNRRLGFNRTTINGLSVLPDSVSVFLEIEPSVDRVVAGVPVRVEGRRSTFLEFQPSSVTLTVTGARSVVAALDRDALVYEIPIEAVAGLGLEEERSVPVQLRGLPTLLWTEGSPDSVRVRPAKGG